MPNTSFKEVSSAKTPTSFANISALSFISSSVTGDISSTAAFRKSSLSSIPNSSASFENFSFNSSGDSPLSYLPPQPVIEPTIFPFALIGTHKEA
jgi:hypothetical protein